MLGAEGIVIDRGRARAWVNVKTGDTTAAQRELERSRSSDLTLEHLRMSPRNQCWNQLIPGKWFDLCQVQGLVNSPNLPKLPRGGIYRLVALTEDDLALRGVNRVCGRDNHGTLYIGRSHNLRMRLSTIARELCARHRGERFYVEGHTVGWLTRHGLLARTFPVNSLALTWSFNKNPLKAEANLLRHYFQSFGEGPPLNRASTIPFR